jgi:5-methylcytosine-specific restriction endonuclease McrA
MWYRPDTPVMIDDINADFLTGLYLHRYHMHTFSVYEDPIYYNSFLNEEEKKKRILYRQIVMGTNGQHFNVIEYSQIYYDENIMNAEQLIREEIIQEYTINDQYKRQDVIFFQNIAHLKEANPSSKKDIKKMKMKQAHALKYPEFIGNIEDEKKNDGFCVFNNFLETYTHIKKDEFIKLCSEVEPVVNTADGISPEQLHHVCKKKDISHYSFDITKKCFLKYVSKNQNYKALVYYAINNHMYHIKNPEIAHSLIRSAVDIETKINSIYFEQDEKKNMFTSGLEIKENVRIKELLTFTESCIVIYPHNHLNDQLIDLMNNNIKPAIKKCKKTMISNMIVQKTKEIKFYLFADENDHSQGLNYKRVKELCEKHDIEFRNQTFTTVIKQIKDQHILQKSQRQEFTKEFKIKFYQTNPRCNNKECNKILIKGDREIDHIIPICKDGHPTDINNLQALCKECHYDKTQDDLDEENIKISKTHSSFSNSVSKVMDSNLNKAWAFVDIDSPSNFNDDDDCDMDPDMDVDDWLEIQAEKDKYKIKKVVKLTVRKPNFL